jgi:hypothetical protein
MTCKSVYDSRVTNEDELQMCISEIVWCSNMDTINLASAENQRGRSSLEGVLLLLLYMAATSAAADCELDTLHLDADLTIYSQSYVQQTGEKQCHS